MEKYLVRIEFRYSDAPETEDGYHSKNKMVTIGVYDTFEEACQNGNNLLEVLESKFECTADFKDGTIGIRNAVRVAEKDFRKL